MDDGQDRHDNQVGQRLVDGIDIKDFKSGKGIEFEVTQEGPMSDDFDDDSTLFANIEVKPQIKVDMSRSFEEIASCMQDISPRKDGGLMKMVQEPGEGDIVSFESWVTIHYSAWQEYSQDPYDSTRLRNNPFKFLVGRGDGIPGLHLSVLTMKKKEVSIFLIAPTYNLGNTGCGERVPGGKTVMFEVELISFVDCMGISDYYRLSPDDRRRVPFKVAEKVALKEINDGSGSFDKVWFDQAIRSYKRGVAALDCINLDEDGKQKRQQLLFALYKDLALCHLMRDDEDDDLNIAVIYADQALTIVKNDAKPYYIKAKALRLKQEYETARSCILRAQSLQPHSKELQQEIQELDRAEALYKKERKSFCEKMFGGKAPTNADTIYRESLHELIPPIREQLRSAFASEPDTELYLPSQGLTQKEINNIIALSSELCVSAVMRGKGRNRHMKLFKK